jgi:hypothetical protein
MCDRLTVCALLCNEERLLHSVKREKACKEGQGPVK